MADSHRGTASLLIHERDAKGRPHNAETLLDVLTEPANYLTPSDLVYHRNHAALPDGFVDDDSWELDVSVEQDVVNAQGWSRWAGEQGGKRTFSLSQLRTREKSRVVAVLECAGNMRNTMNEQGPRATEGIAWQAGVVANQLWEGVKIRSLLIEECGLPDPYGHLTPDEKAKLRPTEESMANDSASWSRSLHLHFLSVQPAQDDRPAGSAELRDLEFGASLPLSHALHPGLPALLAWSANGEALTLSHGRPLRVVLPGYVGARWVKWLAALRISSRANESEPMKEDYKLLIPPPELKGDARDEWLKSMMEVKGSEREEALLKLEPMMHLAPSSAIAVPKPGEVVKKEPDGSFKIRGYATGHQGSAVASVELALVPDDGEGVSPSRLRELAVERDGWIKACDLQSVPSGGQAEGEGTSWGWALWAARAPFPSGNGQRTQRWALVARATTADGFTQEQESPWNVRGFSTRSWPVVRGLSFD